ncbi:MAG: hypothetical protein O3B19_10940 [Actinomycetota bacterium]|nr:hypothetical protein [Actinomycetota bacterium]MDA2972674.1 hypothetical protein [Actinomycetota bacterium]
MPRTGGYLRPGSPGWSAADGSTARGSRTFGVEIIVNVIVVVIAIVIVTVIIMVRLIT